MKKLLLSAVILATVVSCSKNEVAETTPATASEISFSTLNDRVTKAANDNQANFYVFCRNSNTTSATAWEFTDTYSTNVNAATSLSGTTHYWPTDGTNLDFVAVAPAIYDYVEGDFVKDSRFVTTSDAADNIEHLDDYAGGEITFTFQSVDGQTDLTAARNMDVEPTSSSVAFAFDHLLAKIIVKVSLLQDGSGVSPSMDIFTLNNGFDTAEEEGNLTVEFGVHTRRGIYTLNMDGDEDISELVAADDNLRALPGFGYYTHPTNRQSLALAAVNSGIDVNIVPQVSTGCTISLYDMLVTNTDSGTPYFTQGAGAMSYTIQEGAITTTADSSLESDYFHPGYVYVMNLVLDANSFEISTISFTATCADWTNAESDNDADYTTEIDPSLDFNN